MYGLNDAPLLWQLCLKHFLIKVLHARTSLFDDCSFSWLEKGKLTAALTSHVDDILVISTPSWLQKTRLQLEARFGAVSRQTMPLMHVGCLYEHIETDPHGHKTVKISQQHFADSIKLMTVRKAEPTTPCDAQEQHDFRASIGALLYLCMTRLDLVAEVVILQSKVCCSTIGDLLACNQVFRRAKQYSPRGIIYRPLQPPVRILAFSDASFAKSKTSYATEGCLVLITS